MSPTGFQLSQGHRIRKRRRNTVAAFDGAPHRKAIVYQIATMSPRKPNSARRTFAKTRVVINNKRVFAKIPGIGPHFLQAHSVVFLRGKGPKDSPGINYNMIRGLCDFDRDETYGRKNKRSKYGVRKEKK